MQPLKRLPIENIILGMSDCSGSSTWTLHGFVAGRLPLKAETVNEGMPEEVTHPELKEVYFAEIQHFVDRSLYHLAVGKQLVVAGVPTWGLVSFYYAGFFAAQAAIRLRGTAFLRLDYENEINRSPTFRLSAANLVTDVFRIQKATSNTKGEHQRVWSAFYDHYNSFSRDGYADVQPITGLVGPEERVAEMHRRHLLNYVPGVGYYEFRGLKAIKLIVEDLGRGLRGRFKDALDDPDGQLEAGAFLRFRLCCGLLREIADVGGRYKRQHEQFVEARRALLKRLNCPKELEDELKLVM